MLKQKEHFRLPNGKSTTDVDKYIRAYRKLAKPFCEATGFVLHGFDPDIQLINPNNKQHSFTLNAVVAQKIVDYFTKKENQ
jgi:Uma2 family endonuclease